jgi:hypothetical protein
MRSYIELIKVGVNLLAMTSIFTQFTLFGMITFFVITFPYEFVQKGFLAKKEAIQKPQSFHTCE